MSKESLKDKVVFISGASRGIGRAIGLRLVQEGAKIVIAAKSEQPHAKLPGTIHSVAEEIRALGGQALALVMDVRDEGSVKQAFAQVEQTFGGLDVLVNNAGALYLAPTMATPTKRFDLMMAVNIRGPFLCARAAYPMLQKAANPHVLMLSPPLQLSAKWLGPHLPYSLSKYGMSLCVMGLAEELKKDGIAVNALWPKTTIATAAVNNLLGGEAMMARSRKPEIVADAALVIFQRKSSSCSGQFFLDEELLREEGFTDFSQYAVDPQQKLQKDLFVEEL